MSIDQWEEYFGPSDARVEKAEDISNYFYQTDVLDRMKMGERSSGVSIVVGVKGSGKTAIRKMIEFSRQRLSLVWTVDRQYSFDSAQAGSHPAGVESLVISLLTAGVLEQIQENSTEFSTKVRGRVQGTVKRIGSLLGALAKSTTLAAGPIELDLSKISADVVKEFSRIPAAVYREELAQYLEEKVCYILMDDVDQVFYGCASNPAFLEGLIEAVNTINLEFGALLHCLLFLRAGPYWTYRRTAKAYDKTRRSIGAITWTERELGELVARRIRHIGQVTAGEKAWRTWARDFAPSTRAGIGEIQDYVLSRCPRGPRDAIDFCNLAKKGAGQRKITMGDIKDAEAQHSADQLDFLRVEFGAEYPRINDLLKEVFTGRNLVWPRGELAKLTNDSICADTNLKERFGKLQYLRTSYPAEFMRLMYDIGFIGYRTNDESEFVYAMSHPEPAIDLPGAFEHSIHPAYMKHLHLR